MATRVKTSRFLLIISVSFILSSQLFSQVQAEWRGEQRRGIYPGANTLTTWPDGGPKLLWSTEILGDGYASPVFFNDKMYVCGCPDSIGFLFEFDLSGNMLRSVPFGKEWVVNYPGSRVAPTIAEGLVYLTTGLCDLVCIDLATFTVKWRVEGGKEFNNVLPLFGHSESPAVDGDLVFFTPGNPENGVVALNRFNGKKVWSCKGDGERPGYNNPLVIKLMNKTLLVVFSAYSLMGIDIKTGKLLWTHAQDNIPVPERKPGNGDTHSNTVWYDNGALYYIAGDGNGAVRLILAPDGSTIKEVWRNKAIDNYMGGFIKTENLVYSCSDSKKALFSLNITTGEVTDTLKCGTGSLISDGKMFYYYNQRGEVNLVRPGAQGMELAGKFKVTLGTKEHFSHPVIYKCMLFIRHGKALMAYDIRKS